LPYVLKVNLHGQLARGREDQCSHGVTRWREACVGMAAQPLEHRQGEGRCLARAGLGAAHHVTALGDQWDGLFLDGCGCFVALLAHGAQDFRAQPEMVKRQTVVSSLGTEYGLRRQFTFMPRRGATASTNRRER
jgi:hypothetical protein